MIALSGRFGSARVAFTCPSFSGRLRAFEAPGAPLRRMGYEITFLSPAGAGAISRRPGFTIAETPSADGYDPKR